MEIQYQTVSFVDEDETADKIARILALPPESMGIGAVLNSIRENLGIALSQRQSEAVYMAFRSNLSIITGSPGTGKTTVLRAIIEVFGQIYPGKKILLAAPTGRASRRMAESTGRSDAKTLHSLLGLLGESGYARQKKPEPLDADLIIVDESSMIDMWLAKQFFARLKLGTKVILVGDVDQLQSVGAGDVFRELIACGKIPVTVLNEIFRQKKDSLIAHNAKNINEDNTNLHYGDDFLFLKCKTQDEAAEIICYQFCEQVERYGIERVQILSPFRSEGATAVEQLNRTIREMVNPAVDETVPDLKVGSRFYREGDKVMQTKNNFFLRKTDSPGQAYYTLEVEPGGTIRQKRTMYDRQNADIKAAKKFLREWQGVIRERMTDEDRALATTSRILRLQNFKELSDNNVIINTGLLQGQRLVDILMADLMEAA